MHSRTGIPEFHSGSIKAVFKLPPTAFKIWMYHYVREGVERESWPSRETICKELDISLPALKSNRKLLIDYGWLVPKGYRNAVSGEFFTVDEGYVVSKTYHGLGIKNIPRSRYKKHTKK